MQKLPVVHKLPFSVHAQAHTSLKNLHNELCEVVMQRCTVSWPEYAVEGALFIRAKALTVPVVQCTSLQQALVCEYFA